MKIKDLGIITIFCCLLGFLMACHSPVRQYEFTTGKFKKDTVLSGTPVKQENLKMPMGICVFAEKNLLLIIDVQDSMLVKAYDLKSLKFIKSFIKKGPGPNQQLDCHKVQYSADFKHIYAVDRIKQKIYAYNADDISAPGAAVFPESDIMLEHHQIYNPSVLADGSIVDYSSYKADEKSSVFSFYNSYGNLLYKKGDFPKIRTAYGPQEQNAAFLGWFTPFKNGNNIILAYLNTDVLDLYNNQGVLLKRVQGPDYFEPAVKSVKHFNGTMVIPDEKAFHAYSSARAKDNQVYVLYEGKEVLEQGGYHKKLLFNFNSNLEPESLFLLDQPIFAFDIDWSRKELYGLTHQYKDKNLIRIKLP